MSTPLKKAKIVIGIDGGGTKTIALCADDSGDVLAEEVGGPSNFQVIGIDAAAKNLLKLIKACCSKAGVPPQAVATLLLGLAGAGRVSDRERMAAGLLKLARARRVALAKVVIESDARIALEGAFRGTPGIVVIGGTGSIAYGKDPTGLIHRVGGWGRVLGDEGGGYSLGRDGLIAVLRQYDGRGEQTCLTEIFSRRFGFSSSDDIVRMVYSEGFDVASLAPEVIQAAKEGDRVADKILARGAVELEEHIRVLSAKLNSTQKIPTVLMGGVLSGDNYYAKMVRDKLTASLPNIQIQPSMASAAYGAVLMALSGLKRS